MMKKVWLILLAVVLVFGFAVLGCGGGDGGGPGTGPGGGDDVELVETTVFDLETDAGIQALTPGVIANSAFAGSGNPIAPLVRAGENEHITIEIVDNDGKNAIKYRVVSGTWGVGIDLPYAAFGFKAGDVVTLTGEVITGSGKLQLNSNVGGENAIASYTDGVGEFTLTATLTAANVAQISAGNPAGIRLEARAVGMVVQINSITIVGQRPATSIKLATPVVEVTETGVSWATVEGATGYKVYADADEDPIATLGAVTSVNLNNIDALEPGEHTIKVIATGPTGYTDSDASTAVTYNKPAPVVHRFTLSVAGVEQVVEVKAVSGGIEVLEGENGYTFTKGGAYAASYAWFGVTFAETDRLSSFEKVTFKWKGGTGDIGYKNLSLVGSSAAFTGNLTPTNTVNAQWWNDYNKVFEPGPQVNGTAESAQTLIIAADKTAAYTGSTVYFSIYEAAGASASGSTTVFTISDIEFVKGDGAVAKSTAVLDAITVKTEPKNAYDVGDTFDPSDLVITTKMLYGATGTGFAEDIPYNETDFSFSSNVDSAFTEDAELTVTVTYKTKTAEFKILVGEYEPDEFDLATGMTSGITVQGDAVFADGIIDLTGSSSALFRLDLPSATASGGTKVITITYICKVVSGSPQVTLKDGGWGSVATANGTDGCNWYPTLTAGAETTLTLKEGWYADATSTISFQRNGDTNKFKIKIISVTMK